MPFPEEIVQRCAGILISGEVVIEVSGLDYFVCCVVDHQWQQVLVFTYTATISKELFSNCGNRRSRLIRTAVGCLYLLLKSAVDVTVGLEWTSGVVRAVSAITSGCRKECTDIPNLCMERLKKSALLHRPHMPDFILPINLSNTFDFSSFKGSVQKASKHDNIWSVSK